jgi:hypothetical protein
MDWVSRNSVTTEHWIPENITAVITISLTLPAYKHSERICALFYELTI